MESHGQDTSGADSIRFAVVLLAGGRAQRLPGKLDRRGRDGRSLLTTTLIGILDTAPHAPTRIIIAGQQPSSATHNDTTDPAYADPRVHLVADVHPFEGPARAVSSVMSLIDESLTIVLAADAPRGAMAIPRLLSTLVTDPEIDAVLLTTDQRQYLCAAYRTEALMRTSASASRAADLCAGLLVREIADEWHASRDVDTADDARDLGFEASDRA